jgi:hypothetical protein
LTRACELAKQYIIGTIFILKRGINGLILKLTAFQHLSIWAFRKRRALRYNLFYGKKSHKKGFSLQTTFTELR